MTKLTRIVFITTISFLTLSAVSGFSQSKAKKEVSKKRETQRHAMHVRDSMLRIITRTDTSVNGLLQRMEQYTANFNQISNSLEEGVDTVDIGEQLPAMITRVDKIHLAGHLHKSGTLRYLFVLRDNLDRMQEKLDGWQTDVEYVDSRLVQNENDLIKFSNDTVLKRRVPTDTALKKTYFMQLAQVRALWRETDSLNRSILLRVNRLQDRIAVCYTRILDESDLIDTKIKGFATKAIAGESDYVWKEAPQYQDFEQAANRTARMDGLLLAYFFKNETTVHVIVGVFLALIFGWILYNRAKALKKGDSAGIIPVEAGYIFKHPILSPLLIVTAISPYFYNHPPTILAEIMFLISIVLTIVLIRPGLAKETYLFLLRLFALTILYAVSNLLIDISSLDRYLVLVLALISLWLAFGFYKKIKKSPDGSLPFAPLALKIFMALQAISFVLNISGRFSLAKIFGVTGVFSLWFAIVLYVVVNIIIQGLFLHFEAKKGGNNIINWMDYSLVQKKFKSSLAFMVSLLWLYNLLQNLDIDDWAKDHIGDILDQSQSVGGASFTVGGFIIFIAVIWLSSLVSRIISYFYDVSGQRVTDLSVLKKKNRTSALIIRIGVFSLGFLLAVAASGFPLDKLTIIISAFGVGIGFGLQNIVNNLVSGLILAFEKPVNIGDVVEVAGHTGTMKEIGIRSSKIIAGDGSEVIIPNGDFISHQVVNWTMSNNSKQVDLRIITAYGVDLNKVKDLLKGMLVNRNDILSAPAPAVFINNVSEIAVEFKVLFWVVDVNSMGELRSKTLTDVYELLAKEGIQLPGTQKNIYVHFPEGVPLADSGPEKNKKKGDKD
ncbi:MAG TPA: mechanosensitive ion channel domain-containing protein [Mucilaginibacter sp.]|jgi:small-conductance mechanosensitive channel|nr:mechanosensitive ion channel domain-containing protein [Mucilaginibacter sp.]